MKESIFDKMSSEWWDKSGPMRMLHSMNETRMLFIKERIINRYQKIGNLIEEKKGLKLEYNELDIERESLQDPAYMELFLMEKLGLVPEGQIKVHFSDQ